MPFWHSYPACLVVASGRNVWKSDRKSSFTWIFSTVSVPLRRVLGGKTDNIYAISSGIVDLIPWPTWLFWELTMSASINLLHKVLRYVATTVKYILEYSAQLKQWCLWVSDRTTNNVFLIRNHPSWPLGNLLIENLLGNIIDMEDSRVPSEVSFRADWHCHTFSHAQQMQNHCRGSCQGDVEQGDSTHAQTHSISDTNAASALPAVSSTQRCGPAKPPLLLLQGLLQVQGGTSDPAAVAVVAGLTWPSSTNKSWQRVDIGLWCSSEIKYFWGNKDRNERKFITTQLQLFSSWN